MVATRKLEIQITGDPSGAGRAFATVREDADSTESRMSKWGKAIGSTVAFGFATDAIVNWGSTIISAAEESQQVTKQTTATINSMGAASWTTADAIAELANQISLKTGLDDEMIQSGENVLLTFGQVRDAVGEGNDIFTRATKVATDMSVAMGQDLQSSIVQVGKALNDPVAGLGSLSRVGVQFTDQQKDMIGMMVAAGDTMGAQKLILGELERQFSGSAEAQATASSKLKTAWDNVLEQLGTYLLPAFDKVATWLAATLPTAIDTSVEWIKKHEGEVKAFAIVVGVIAVAALVLYAAAMWNAAAATIAATWPVLLAVVALAALTAAAIYAYTHIDFFRKIVDDTVDQLQDLWKWVKDNKELFEQLGPVIKFVVLVQLTALLILITAIAAAVAVTVNWFKLLATAVDKVVGAVSAVRKASAGLAGLPGPIGGIGKVLGFAEGGVVPGPIGAPQLAVVHGGETVTPPGGKLGGGDVINISVYNQGSVLSERNLVDTINSALLKGYRLHSSGREL